jgi:hypothetical protein
MSGGTRAPFLCRLSVAAQFKLGLDADEPNAFKLIKSHELKLFVFGEALLMVPNSCTNKAVPVGAK